MKYSINESVASAWADGQLSITINEKLALNAILTSFHHSNKDGTVISPLFSTPDYTINPYWKMLQDAMRTP